MNIILGKSIEKGHKVRTTYGWRKVLEVTDEEARVKEGTIKYGEQLYGWKSK